MNTPVGNRNQKVLLDKKEILEYNKRCAEFLGWEYDSKHDDYEPTDCKFGSAKYLSDMQFHSDWNWIMEVLKGITKIGYNWELIDFKGTVKEEKFMKCSIFDLQLNTPFIKFTYESADEKEAVTEAINNFLIWYNDNTNK